MKLAMASDQTAAAESPLLTRGGGDGGEDAGSGLGEGDPGLSETDPEVWEIINAERRRQVRGGGLVCVCVCERLARRGPSVTRYHRPDTILIFL